MKGLKNPYIVPILDSSEVGEDVQYYVMPYLEGAISLTKAIKEKKCPFKGNPVKSLKMYIQILEGLKACCDLSIVHRDLSPNNVLILPDESIQIIDFGICQVEGNGTITSTHEGLGTRCYNAPECGAGFGTPIGIQADIYSAAKVLWSAVTGEWAFERETPVFQRCCMKTMFPSDPRCWHLQEIFEWTIRLELDDRCPSPHLAIEFAWRVLRALESNIPPIEEILRYCSSCGLGRMADAPDARLEFKLNGIGIRKCSRCGFVEFRDREVLSDTMEKKRTLK